LPSRMFRERRCHYPRNTTPVTLPPGHLPIFDNIPQFSRLSSGTGSFSVQRGSLFLRRNGIGAFCRAGNTLQHPADRPFWGPDAQLVGGTRSADPDGAILGPSTEFLPPSPMLSAPRSHPVRSPQPTTPSPCGGSPQVLFGRTPALGKAPDAKNRAAPTFFGRFPAPSGRMGRTACTAGNCCHRLSTCMTHTTTL